MGKLFKVFLISISISCAENEKYQSETVPFLLKAVEESQAFENSLDLTGVSMTIRNSETLENLGLIYLCQEQNDFIDVSISRKAWNNFSHIAREMLIYSAISLCVLKKPFDTYQQYIVLIFYNKDGDGEVLMEPFSYSVPFIKEDMREEVYYKLKPYYLDMLYKGESDKIDPTDFNIIHE